MGSADFFMRHRALPWPVPSIRLRIWFVTVVLGAITLQIPGLRAQTTSTTEGIRSEEHTSELQSRLHLVCRLLLEKKNINVSRMSRTIYSCLSNTRPYRSKTACGVSRAILSLAPVLRSDVRPLDILFQKSGVCNMI